jgi:hypothetical protein
MSHVCERPESLQIEGGKQSLLHRSKIFILIQRGVAITFVLRRRFAGLLLAITLQYGDQLSSDFGHNCPAAYAVCDCLCY